MTSLNDARTFAIDLGERALNSAWQGAAAVAFPVILAANTGDTVRLAWWQQIASIAGTGALAGLLSLVKGLIAGVKTGSGSLSSKVAQTAVEPGAHAADNPAATGATPDPEAEPLPDLPQPGDSIYVADGTSDDDFNGWGSPNGEPTTHTIQFTKEEAS